MRYKVMEDDRIVDDIDDVLEHCIDYEYHWDDDYFEEWVNENWGYITIDGYDYYAYDILDKAGDLDSVRDDYCDRCYDDDRDEAEHSLRRAEIGETIDIQAYTVEILDDEYEVDAEEEEPTNKVEEVRWYLEEQKMLEDSAAEEAKKREENLMKLFQVIAND